MSKTNNSNTDNNLSAEKTARLIELRAEGVSLDKIAGELNMSKTTVSRHVYSLNIEIKNRKYEIMDTMLEKYRCTKQAQLSTYLENYEVALNELKSRGFTEMKTRELIEYIKFIENKIENEKMKFKYNTGESEMVDLASSPIFYEEIQKEIDLE